MITSKQTRILIDTLAPTHLWDEIQLILFNDVNSAIIHQVLEVGVGLFRVHFHSGFAKEGYLVVLERVEVLFSEVLQLVGCLSQFHHTDVLLIGFYLVL